VDNFQLGTPELPTVVGMAATITVDIPTLHRLAADLAGLAGRLDADNKDGTCIGDWISDPKIRTALKDVQHDWSHKRAEFTGYLVGVGHAAQAAADAYGQTDQHIADAARP
jgi:hypothetical protein